MPGNYATLTHPTVGVVWRRNGLDSSPHVAHHATHAQKHNPPAPPPPRARRGRNAVPGLARLAVSRALGSRDCAAAEGAVAGRATPSSVPAVLTVGVSEAASLSFFPR